MTRPLSRSRMSPKSPLKRVFGPSPDSGNPIPPSSSAESRGQENTTYPNCPVALSPATRGNLDRSSRHSLHLDVSGSTKNGLSKFMEVNNEPFPSISVSPLKRSDADMSLGQTSFGSPVAKRRSLHGISTSGAEPSVFDQTPAPPPQNFDIHEDGDHEYELTGTYQSPFRDLVASPAMPKRTSSLRRSTLQQRQGNTQPSWGRRAGEKQLAQLATDPGTPAARSRPRLSLDQYVPPEERSNPFSQATMSPHPAQRTANHPHPLSRLVPQSSSGLSHADEEFPTQRPLLPQVLSKSLPPGSLPPVNDSEEASTPHYKGARPLQSAFMSTGLVSKMNRNPDGGPLEHPRAKATAMPDTPCKKQPYYSATFPPQGGSGGRRSRISFGSPSTPFSAVAAPIRGNLFGTPDKSNSLLFQQVRSGHTRKGSMLSVDDDELPEAHDDLPPTPTKNLFFKSHTAPNEGGQSPGDRRSFAARAPQFCLGRDPRDTNANSKPDPVTLSMDDLPNDNSPSVERPPRPSTPFSGGGSPCLGFSFASVAGSRSHPVSFTTPAPARTSPALLATFNSAAGQYAKVDGPSTASVLNMENMSPHTPRDAPGHSMTPPDPTSLSISHLQDGNAGISRTPATPSNSQARQLFSSFASRRLSITPRNSLGPGDVDESLLSRFDKSEVVGKGEFSQVYRVVKSSAPGSFMMPLSTTPRTPSSPSSDRVYAVKKLLPFQGVHDRNTKLREVAVLQSLCHCSKVVQFIDSWEHNKHLYIQTEFCSEGSLDGFLKSVGQAGRLDDFRIWKILLETAQGLSAIHSAGFIHLDIKPANIFINFDGYLKIGDFGLATSWPAPKGIDGEGDREYIAAEILRGEFDKPADIFALGLIILEIACNVFLPDNGPTWQALRAGDLSAVPPLTCGEAGAITRDANGLPLAHDSGISQVSDGPEVGLGISPRRGSLPYGAMTHNASNLFGAQKRTESQRPPSFMLDPNDPHSLDNLVKWMLKPNAADRPTAEQVLESEPVSWISNHRTAGATVFEGNWGPRIGPSVEEFVDTEMMDV
ncbi:hypothetical protein F5144DRAFT_590923 [Chaetomium tenue]|uniref:Uncharacterized protein n=1 Tax=Chaetomium tenue TaxID=1854479 RepID=A0ACB7PL66_9PEZI|nr:hypothetical protein F5144DRAFT_590923 [Chaetomium globosum]